MKKIAEQLQDLQKAQANRYSDNLKALQEIEKKHPIEVKSPNIFLIEGDILVNIGDGYYEVFSTGKRGELSETTIQSIVNDWVNPNV